MVDFKRRVAELNMQTGGCSLSICHYASVKGIRCSPQGVSPVDYGEKVKVHFRIDQDGDRFVIQFLNGVTGYEAFNIDDILADPCYDYWSICGGCHRYDRLDIDGAQLMEFLEHFDKIIRPSLLIANNCTGKHNE